MSKRRYTRRGKNAAVVIFAIGVAAVLAVYFKPDPSPPAPVSVKDPLCRYINDKRLECLALPADESTYRPGAVTRLVDDPREAGLKRVDPPFAYLDEASCIVPGATLGDWKPERRTPEFDLPTVAYSNAAIAHLRGQLTEGLQINLGPKAQNIQQVDLSFGPARTTLLDQFALLNRIEDCALTVRCISRIQAQKDYRVVNRVLVAEDMTVGFKDSRGISISAEALRKDKAISIGGMFDLAQGTTERLSARRPMAVGVQLIDDNALRSVQPCVTSAKFAVEGGAQVTAGGAGAPGHMPENAAPVSRPLGETASLELRGDELQRGQDKRTQSFAKVAAAVVRTRDNELSLSLNVQVQGGHYENRILPPPLGGPVSTHDTGANATARADGRINVLVREPNGWLKVSWSGLPAAGESVTSQSSITVNSPSGAPLRHIATGSQEGSQWVELRNEGLYAVVTTLSMRGETSGASGQRSGQIQTRVAAEVSFQAPDRMTAVSRRPPEPQPAPRPSQAETCGVKGYHSLGTMRNNGYVRVNPERDRVNVLEFDVSGPGSIQLLRDPSGPSDIKLEWSVSGCPGGMSSPPCGATTGLDSSIVWGRGPTQPPVCSLPRSGPLYFTFRVLSGCTGDCVFGLKLQ